MAWLSELTVNSEPLEYLHWIWYTSWQGTKGIKCGRVRAANNSQDHWLVILIHILILIFLQQHTVVPHSTEVLGSIFGSTKGTL